MKIAFTSCMSATAYPRQPVWEQILAQTPYALVLLGDSIYNDCPHPLVNGDFIHPKDPAFKDDAFCKHVHGLYTQQLAVPEFKALIGKLSIYTIWDDHDFLWNDADASDSQTVLNRGKAYYSSQLFQCWREALKIGGQSFPKSHGVARIQKDYANLINEDYNAFMPGYSTIEITKKKIILHLTDGRSWRKGGILGTGQRSMLGTGQRLAMEDMFKDNPNALHLIASGSTFGGRGNQGWAGYPLDYEWLFKLSSQYKILMLSGDIHQNRFSAPIGYNGSTGGMKLFEATSSGAAIDFIHVHDNGQSSTKDKFNYSEHFGILDLKTNGDIDVSLYDHNKILPNMKIIIPASFQ